MTSEGSLVQEINFFGTGITAVLSMLPIVQKLKLGQLSAAGWMRLIDGLDATHWTPEHAYVFDKMRCACFR
jgi:hypothetical protein